MTVEAKDMAVSDTTTSEQKKEKSREQWANKTEYILSNIGYAVGIGNVWRFPYLCYRSGGGAFFVPYLTMLFLCGIPLFFMETSLGQFASTGCISLFKIAPIFKGAGYTIVILNFIVCSYFITICAYPLLFIYYCFSTKLPWVDCDNPWNTNECAKLGFDARNLSLISNGTLLFKKSRTPADEFFHNEMLRMSSSIDDVGGIVWPLFTSNLIAWVAVYLCIMRGVKTVGKVVYFTAVFPFFILFVLLVRGLTLPGAWDGVYYYIYPQWSQLTNLKVWADAAIQIFYSLGPGWGGLPNMASYNQFNNNNKLDSISVPIINCGTSILAGFVVFSVIGFMSNQTGLPVSSVAAGGPGLAFVTYPEAISLLPGALVWAHLFFAMMFFLGLDSAFVQIEAIVSSLKDECPCLGRLGHFLTFFVCLSMMLFSTLYTTNSGMYWLSLFDWYSASISVILVCFVETVIVGYSYGVKNFIKDVEFMTGEKLSWYWLISWKIITPGILLFMFITTITFNTRLTYGTYSFPDWAISTGWCSCLASVVCIPLYIGYYLLYTQEGDIIERTQAGLRPSVEWGPANKVDRVRWLRMKSLRKKSTRIVDPYHEQFVQLCAVEN